MALAADHQRNRAVETLRREYVLGRLDEIELDRRTDIALRARTTAEIRSALGGLPWLEDAVRRAAKPVKLALSLVLLAAVWLLASLVLLLTFGVALIASGPEDEILLGFPLAWLAVTAAAVWAGSKRLRGF